MTSYCTVRVMAGRVVIRLFHDKGAMVSELDHAEAIQVRDALNSAIQALESEQPFPETLQGFIDTFKPTVE